MMKTKENFMTKNELEVLRRINKPSKSHELLSKIFCMLFDVEPKRKRNF